MIYGKQIGVLTLNVNEPTPCWIQVSTDNGAHCLRISHRDLRDLEHLVQTAIAECNRMLPEREKI